MVLSSSVYRIKCGFALNEKVCLQLWIPVYSALMTRAAEWCRWTIMTSCYQRAWTDVARQAGIAQVSMEVNKILMIYLASFSLLPELSFLLDMRSGKPGPLLVTTLEKQVSLSTPSFESTSLCLGRVTLAQHCVQYSPIDSLGIFFPTLLYVKISIQSRQCSFANWIETSKYH